MSQVNLDILYEDHHLLVINKPAGINADDFERRVHRLDKDTSGILLLAKNDEDLKFFQIWLSAARRFWAWAIKNVNEDI